MSSVAALEVTPTDDGIRIRVRVAPRASRAAILGVHDGALKVSLTAPPVDGAANEALRKLLAKALGISKAAVEIRAGEQSRNKTLQLRGVSAPDVLALLAG